MSSRSAPLSALVLVCTCDHRLREYLASGGGAVLDGIARHYLRVRATPGSRTEDVAILRVD